MTAASLVFQLHPVKENVLDAWRFGAIKMIGERFVYADEINNQQVPLVVAQRINEAARLFSPEHDYLLIVGDHLQVALMCAELGARFGEFNVLRWERSVEAYMPVHISTGHRLYASVKLPSPPMTEII